MTGTSSEPSCPAASIVSDASTLHATSLHGMEIPKAGLNGSADNVSARGRPAWVLARQRVKVNNLRIAENGALQERARSKNLNRGDGGNDSTCVTRQAAKDAMRLIAWKVLRSIRVSG